MVKAWTEQEWLDDAAEQEMDKDLERLSIGDTPEDDYRLRDNRIEALRAATSLAENGNELFQWDGKNVCANEYILNVAELYARWLETGGR